MFLEKNEQFIHINKKIGMSTAINQLNWCSYSILKNSFEVLAGCCKKGLVYLQSHLYQYSLGTVINFFKWIPLTIITKKVKLFDWMLETTF
jgi:hypothetical protein